MSLTLAGSQLEAAAPLELQIATVVVASVAALAAIFAAVVSAYAASRRERASWLREQQMKAYEAFSVAAHAATSEATTGAVDRALQAPFTQGLDESWEIVRQPQGEVHAAMRPLLVVGQQRSLRAASTFILMLSDVLPLCYPLSGAAHAPALAQRNLALTALLDASVHVDQAFRADLHVVGRREQRALNRAANGEPTPTSSDLAPRAPDKARGQLALWLVRDWDYQDKDSWIRNDTPWAMLNLQHRVLFQPLVAMAIKRPDFPWRAAISSDLEPSQVREIEADLLDLIRHGGRGSGGHFGGKQWVEGEVPGEKIWWWTEADAPPRSNDSA
ncbi:hypothetical protein [Microbacterium sp.]